MIKLRLQAKKTADTYDFTFPSWKSYQEWCCSPSLRSWLEKEVILVMLQGTID